MNNLKKKKNDTDYTYYVFFFSYLKMKETEKKKKKAIKVPYERDNIQLLQWSVGKIFLLHLQITENKNKIGKHKNK